MKYPRKWEEINEDGWFRRLKIHGGWLAYVIDDGSSMVYVPDPEHRWELEPIVKQGGGNRKKNPQVVFNVNPNVGLKF